MALIYKPIRQFMTPNDETIDPKEDNTFQCIINGQRCIAYRFRVYDMQNNLYTKASTDREGALKRFPILDINVIRDEFLIGTNELSNGDEIRFHSDDILPEPLKEDTPYYVGNFNFGIFKVYETKEDALNEENEVNILSLGSGNPEVIFPTILYNGDNLDIVVEKDIFEAGNDYKWQVDLYAKDMNLEFFKYRVVSIDTSANTWNVYDANGSHTGDPVSVFATKTWPTNTEKNKTYYIRKKVETSTEGYTVLSVNISDNTLNIGQNHELKNGDAVKVTSTGELPGGLTADTLYYVRKKTITDETIERDEYIYLYDTEAHAKDTAKTDGLIDLTNAGSGTITVRGDNPVVYLYDTYEHAVDTTKTTGLIDVNSAGEGDIYLLTGIATSKNHNLTTGDTVYLETDSVLPMPFETYHLYYVRKIDVDKIALFNYIEGARNDAGRIVPYDLGGEANTTDSTATVKDFEKKTDNGNYILIHLNEDVPVDASDLQLEWIADDGTTTGKIAVGKNATIDGYSCTFTSFTYGIGTSETQEIKVTVDKAFTENTLINISLWKLYYKGRQNFRMSNVVVSEQIPFLVYDRPTITLETTTIDRQSYTFVPTYSHPQEVGISSFEAFLMTDDLVQETSGLQEGKKLEWTFDGMLSGNTYYVKFVIHTNVNQTYDTGYIPFSVEYLSPDLGISPTVENLENMSAINMQWSGIKQIIGDMYGEYEWVDPFVREGNIGLKLFSDSYLVFSDLDIHKGSSPPMFWWNPCEAGFTGVILRTENTNTGEYIEIGYNGVNFYREINGIVLNNARQDLNPDLLYQIGMTQEELIVTVIGNVTEILDPISTLSF